MIEYTLCKNEERARLSALGCALRNKTIVRETEKYGEAADIRVMIDSWDLPVVLVPKEKFEKPIYQDETKVVGLKYRHLTPHNPEYTNFTVFPCVEVRNPEGEPVAYYAFEEGPEQCYMCKRFREATNEERFIEGDSEFKPVPICPYKGHYIGQQTDPCESRIPTSHKTHKEKAQELFDLITAK
jgi:hypothetical protein